MSSNRSVRYVDFGYSTARQFWEEAGLPAYQRFVEHKNRQTAIDACLHSWHIHEWVWHEENPGVDTRGNAAYSAFRDNLIQQCEELSWVRDVADASKHRGLGRQTEVTGVHDRQVFSGGIVKTPAGLVKVPGMGLIRVPSRITLVTIELTDDSKLPLADVLATVITFWNLRLGVTSQ